MYQGLSSAFHSKIIDQNAKQNAFLLFDEYYLSGSDGDFTTDGITYTDSISSNDNINLGETISASIDVSLNNQDNVFYNARFGEAELFIGVQTSTTSEALTNGESFRVHDTLYDYSAQGDKLVIYDTQSSGTAEVVFSSDILRLWVYGGNVYVATKSALKKLKISGLSSIESETIKCSTLISKKCTNSPFIGITFTSNIVKVYAGDKTAHTQEVSVWEYCPMGIFNFDDVDRSGEIISATACDRMAYFDKNYEFSAGELSYPISYEGFLNKICNKVGIGHVELTNTTTISKDVFSDKNITYRSAISYLAEACSCYAKINRDGKLEFKFLDSEVDIVATIPRTQIASSSRTMNEIMVFPTTLVRNSNVDGDVFAYGTDTQNIYEMQGNPLVSGEPQSQYEALSKIPKYKSIEIAVLEADVSLDAGDYIKIQMEDGGNRTLTNANGDLYTNDSGSVWYVAKTDYVCPIVSQSITFSGGKASGGYAASGTTIRETQSSADRQAYSSSLTSTKEGIQHILSTLEIKTNDYTPTYGYDYVTGKKIELPQSKVGMKIDLAKSAIYSPRFGFVGQNEYSNYFDYNGVMGDFKFKGQDNTDDLEPVPPSIFHEMFNYKWGTDEQGEEILEPNNRFNIKLTTKGLEFEFGDMDSVYTTGWKKITLSATGLEVIDYTSRKGAYGGKKYTSTGIIEVSYDPEESEG